MFTESMELLAAQCEEWGSAFGALSRGEYGEYDGLAEWVDSNILEIDYIVSAAGEYQGVQLTLALGGPNIHADTRLSTITGHWGDDHYTTRFDSVAINDFLREIAPQSLGGCDE